MQSDKPFFDSDYSKGSQTLPIARQTVTPLPGALSETTPGERDSLTPVKVLIDSQRYGAGKPFRVVIRGKISRD